MLNSFRQSMAWVHTWFGLVLGFVLMVVFFFFPLELRLLSVLGGGLPQLAVPDDF